MKLIEKRMREIMAIRKLSTADIAAAIGASHPHICNVLKGRRSLGLKYSKRLIEFIGADLISFAIDWRGIEHRAGGL